MEAVSQYRGKITNFLYFLKKKKLAAFLFGFKQESIGELFASVIWHWACSVSLMSFAFCLRKLAQQIKNMLSLCYKKGLSFSLAASRVYQSINKHALFATLTFKWWCRSDRILLSICQMNSAPAFAMSEIKLSLPMTCTVRILLWSAVM